MPVKSLGPTHPCLHSHSPECQQSRQSQRGQSSTGLLSIVSSPNTTASNSPYRSSRSTMWFICLDRAFLSMAAAGGWQQGGREQDGSESRK